MDPLAYWSAQSNCAHYSYKSYIECLNLKLEFERYKKWVKLPFPHKLFVWGKEGEGEEILKKNKNKKMLVTKVAAA